MPKPFEGLFGDSSELRVIQFMMPLKGLEFNISELARGTGVTRQTLVHVVKKLVKWNALKITTKHGNANYFALNEGSGYVEAFERLNNCIIEQMLGEEALNQIADYWKEHAPIVPPKPIRMNAKSWRINNPFGIEEGWIQPPKLIEIPERPPVFTANAIASMPSMNVESKFEFREAFDVT